MEKIETQLRWLKVKAWLLVIILGGSWCYHTCLAEDPPEKPPTALVQSAKKATVPQALLDVLEKIEEDRQSIQAAETALSIANTAAQAAESKKKTAEESMAGHQAEFLKIWVDLYGPIPDPVPDPGPTPPPDPDPEPDPTPQKIQLIVIEEVSDSSDTTSEEAAAMAKLRNSKKIHDWKETGGHGTYFIDRDAAAKGGGWKTWSERAKGKDIPWLFVTTTTGTLITEMKCPMTVEEYMAVAEKYGGKNTGCPTGLCPVDRRPRSTIK